MIDIRDIIAWFSGGRNGYMTLIHCMNDDVPWIVVTVVLDLVITIGYVAIALHWRRNELLLRDSPAKRALSNMKRIFIYCGLCGYLFIPIKMFWPAWRLYDILLAFLAYFTWSYILKARGLGVVYRNLDRTEQLAEELLKAKEEVRRKRSLFSAVSHNLKTPLHGLTLQTELAAMQLQFDEPDAAHETIGQMKNCLQTMTSLLNHFLELGRLESHDQPVLEQEFAVAEALKLVVGTCGDKADAKSLTVELLDETETRIVTNREAFDRILSNLVDNAIQFTAAGSVRIRVEAQSPMVSVEVADTGKGIAPENHQRIFDDFYQVDNPERDHRKGFGLGLSISRRLAEQIGAKITLESELNKGSRFTVHLTGAVRGGRLTQP